MSCLPPGISEDKKACTLRIAGTNCQDSLCCPYQIDLSSPQLMRIKNLSALITPTVAGFYIGILVSDMAFWQTSAKTKQFQSGETANF
jgi:hypothetical protein